ncbi:MAG: WD40/YVTN/BNR-like repeat-containing protein [Planctomycetaceae bacterium]
MSCTLLVATRKGLFTFVRQPRGWEVDHIDFLGENVSMLLDDPRDQTLYAGLALGHFGAKLRRQSQGGEWVEVGVPVYPEGAVFSVWGGPDAPPQTKPASMQEFWSLETAGADRPGELWAGTIPGGLYHSTDRGQSWRLIESLWNRPERMGWFGGGKDYPGIHSVCVDPRDSQHVTVGISCGGVWETRDAGENWTLIGKGLRNAYMPPDMQYDQNSQDPHRLAQCPADPNVMWVQHHNGVFHSTDGAQTFREIAETGPSVFGFAVVTHPTDPQTAWLVPGVKDECRIPVDAKLCVTRTHDGGSTWETLRNGLPQQHCYDLVFRHGLDIDATGSRLVIGSSTGGLWITEDGGDSWQAISTTLPQIYCARFRRW